MRIRELLPLFSSEHVRAKGKADNTFGSVWINQSRDISNATRITSLAVATVIGGGSELTEGTPEALILSGFQNRPGNSSLHPIPLRPRTQKKMPRVAVRIKWIIYKGEASRTFDVGRVLFICNKFGTWEKSKNCLCTCCR